jgi:autotransporter-associated beta strand protein
MFTSLIASPVRACVRALYLSLIIIQFSAAQSADGLTATWSTVPANGDWNLPSNWSSGAVPNGAAAIAVFGVSTVSNLSNSADTEVDSIVFNSSASAYTIATSSARTFTVSGAGIVNNSGAVQTLLADVDRSGNRGTIQFTNFAVLGASTTLISNVSPVRDTAGAVISFLDGSSAGLGTLVANGGSAITGDGGRIHFRDASTAHRATLITNGGPLARSGQIHFYGASTAAQATITNRGAMLGGIETGGTVQFYDSTNAGAATIINEAPNVSGTFGGGVGFHDSANAGIATIINKGGVVPGTYFSATGFTGNSSAGNSVIINEGGAYPGLNGGETGFDGNATAGAATLIATGAASGGRIEFRDNSSGGTARVELSGNAFLNIRQHHAPGVTIGSLNGTGVVYLGANTLSIGSNNLSTEFSGLIQTGGPFSGGPDGGGLTKVGAGTLVLSGSSTYNGATTVQTGSLIMNGSIVSAVTVNGGRFGGSGSAGAIAVSDGGTLAPGSNGPGILKSTGNLTLTLGATYLVDVNGTAVGTQYDQMNVIGTVDLANASLSLSIGGPLAIGDQFVIVNNDASDPITGTFNGFFEGATFREGTQAFRISYLGGDGNDVVVTAVVPEPATWLLFVTGVLFFVLRFRPRAKSPLPADCSVR